MAASSILFDHLSHWASVQPDAAFMVEAETGRTVTYAQTLAAVHRLRRDLGDAPACVPLALPGGVENGLVWLSALTGGHTLLPFAPQATAHEAARLSSLFAPDVVVVERLEDASRLGICGARVMARETWQGLLAAEAPAAGQAPGSVGGRICLLTSGSTGDPKGVLLEERQLAWTAEQIRSSHRLTPMDRGLAVLPFFHINAPVVSLLASLLAGSTVVIAPHFRRSHFWEWVERHSVTWASVVPTIVAMLLETEAPACLPGTLRFLRTASAPLPALQQRRFEQKFGVPIIETYGLTEAASQVCANPLPPERHLPGSVGRPVGFSLRICRPRTPAWRGPCPLEDVPTGGLGEICIAGPGLISAYVGEAGGAAFEGSWFRTGDLGYQDAKGYVYLTGRLRDVIIRGGENVAPREIEEVLLAHPAVSEAAVVGRPDPFYGEQVVAYVVASTPWTAELEDELRTLCAERLIPYKAPSDFVAIAALPRTHTGKLDRQRLRREQAGGDHPRTARVSVA